MGILPGGGSFYTREYALGVVNLLFWPISICWDPVSGHRAAEKINYIETKEYVMRLKEKEMMALNQRRLNGVVDDYTYNMELTQISQRYDMDPIVQPIMYAPPYQNNRVAPNPVNSKEQRVRALQQQNVPYDEYQRRYEKIMAE